MSRAVPAVLLLLTLSALVPAGDAQQPSGFRIPTQQDAIVGGLNVTMWIMRDPTTIAYTPDLGTTQDPNAYLGYLWNYNFTAGSLGTLFVQAQPLEGNASYDVAYEVASSSPWVTWVPTGPQQGTGATTPQTRGCVPTDSPQRTTCRLGGNVTSAGSTFVFTLRSAAPAGPAGVNVTATVSRNTTGTPEPLERRTFTATLQVLDPLPPYAVKATPTPEVTLGAWTNGGPLAGTSGGCLGGSQLRRNENVSNGAPGVICLLAVSRGDATLRVTGSLRGPEWFIAPPSGWTSEPFNSTSGGRTAPVHGFAFQTNGKAPLGPAMATLHYRLERQAGDNWTLVNEGDLEVPFTVQAAQIIVAPPTGLNWLAHGPLLVASVAGLSYLAYTNRKPKFESRSQALKAEQVRREVKDDDAAATVIAEQQRQEVQEAAWSKKRQILEAKREDILKSIRIAEERHQRGEITEHVLNGIRERKERQLEQVQKEMEEQGSE